MFSLPISLFRRSFMWVSAAWLSRCLSLIIRISLTIRAVITRTATVDVVQYPLFIFRRTLLWILINIFMDFFTFITSCSLLFVLPIPPTFGSNQVNLLISRPAYLTVLLMCTLSFRKTLPPPLHMNCFWSWGIYVSFSKIALLEFWRYLLFCLWPILWNALLWWYIDCLRPPFSVNFSSSSVLSFSHRISPVH